MTNDKKGLIRAKEGKESTRYAVQSAVYKETLEVHTIKWQ